MKGFFVGDIIGNSYTHENEKYNKRVKDFELFTERSKFSDDTILSVATMDWLLNTDKSSKAMIDVIKKYYKKYPDKTPTIYGKPFADWVEGGCKSFRKSFGNGGAMRCSPIGWYAKSTDEIDDLIEKGISPTHDTKEGKLGAKIVCYAIWKLKNGTSKEELKFFLENTFKIDFTKNIDEYRREYAYTSDAVETVRPAIISFLNSVFFEDAIRNAVSFGGDTDTITTICAAISEAFYKDIPELILKKAESYLPIEFKKIIDKFNNIIS